MFSVSKQEGTITNVPQMSYIDVVICTSYSGQWFVYILRNRKFENLLADSNKNNNSVSKIKKKKKYTPID